MVVRDTVKPYPRGDDEIIFDVRPFGQKQGEAIDSYLHTRLMHMSTTGIGTTRKLVVLLCDSTATIPESVNHWLTGLKAGGQRAEIQCAAAPEKRSPKIGDRILLKDGYVSIHSIEQDIAFYGSKGHVPLQNLVPAANGYEDCWEVDASLP